VPTFTTSDEVELHFVDEGRGASIVFTAGWAMDCSWWRGQAPLADRHRTILVDPRSQGRSEKVTRGLRLARGARDLYEFFEHLDLTDVTLVAWSRSSSIAFAYWELFGAYRLTRLVLIGVTPSMSQRPDWEWGFSEPPTSFQERLLMDPITTVREVIPAIFHVLPPQEILDEFVRSTLLTPPEAGAKMLDDHGVIDWRDMLPTISIPTLVCVGVHDRNAPPGAAAYVSEAVQRGELVVFNESAHAPFFEEADRFNDVLDRFIRQTSGATPGVPTERGQHEGPG
jgi:pimeloyl-ACP methyl ester carboxylesterase